MYKNNRSFSLNKVALIGIILCFVFFPLKAFSKWSPSEHFILVNFVRNSTSHFFIITAILLLRRMISHKIKYINYCKCSGLRSKYLTKKSPKQKHGDWERERETERVGLSSLGLTVKLLPELSAPDLASWHLVAVRTAAGCSRVPSGAPAGFLAALSADPTASALGRPAIQPQ